MAARPKRVQSIVQHPKVQPKQDSAPTDVVGGAKDLSEFPLRLHVEHLCRIFDLHKSRIYQLVEAGRFDRFELTPTIGRRAWSRELLQRYLDGEVTDRKFAPWTVAVGGRK